MLYPFQEKAVEFHLAHHYSINASEMGCGKSLMALETARRSGLKAVVFAPAFLRGTWAHECKKAGVAAHFIPYSMLHKVHAKDLEGFDFWIADEAHYLKNGRAQRTSKFHTLLKGKLPKYYIALTGTPIKNRVPDIWTLIGFCTFNPQPTSGLKLEPPLNTYRGFCRHFCNSSVMVVKGMKIETYSGIKESAVGELKALLSNKYIRFRVEDVLKDLPEITAKDVFIDNGIDEELDEEFQEHMEGRRSKTDIIAKTASAALKAPTTAEYVKGMLENNSGPVLVFSDHVDSSLIIHQGITGSKLITGATPMHARIAAVEEFQNGKLRALVATIGALSVGVTLTAANHVVFNDLSWVPSDNQQALKRIHRIGQKNACFVHYINATETDAHIRRTLEGKLATINKVI